MSTLSSPEPTTTTTTTTRPVGGTEYSWCKAVPTGTGVTVSAILLSKPPDLPLLHSSILKLQSSHPILRSKLHFNPSTSLFSISTPSPLNINIPTHNFPHPFTSLLEHEINSNPWSIISNPNNNNIPTESNNPTDPNNIPTEPNNIPTESNKLTEHNKQTEQNKPTELNKLNEQNKPTELTKLNETDVMFVSVYNLEDGKWAVVMKLHTVACDRAAASVLVRELVGLMSGGVEEGGKEEGVGLAVEECIPAGKSNKPFWARGADMIGYSVNSFRFSNLEFKESGVPDSTRLVRLKIGVEDTKRILDGCKSKGVKLCGLLAAAGFIVARASKDLPDEKWEKYSLATLINCRSLLDPVLSDHHIGFYHSAIINSHDVKGGEDLWDLAQKINTSFTTAKGKNKHFTDMADLNFLMCKAIENPGLTPSSSLRTSLISVFEEPVIENDSQFCKDIGLLDHISCASVHGVSPSLAIFDSIRDGELDCACVYPSPTHSREQMQDFVDHMKKILVGCTVP